MRDAFQCHASRGVRSTGLALLMLAIAGTAQARTETFRWLDPNPLPSPVVAFRIHLGSSARNYTTVLDVGLPTPDGSGVYSASTEVVDAAVVYVAMTAYDITNLESGYSNEQVRSPSGGPPTALPDAYALTQDTVLVVDVDAGVLTNDSDPESDPMTAVLVTDVTSGALLLNADGSFQYAPAPGYAGGDSFSYQASDGILASGVATVTLSVGSSGHGSFVPAVVTVDVGLVATGFDGLDSPVYLTSPSGDLRLFTLEAGGRILVIENGAVSATPFLDLSANISAGPDTAHIGLVFDPDYDQNGFFYVHRTISNGDSVLSRFSVSSDPNVADAVSEEVLLQLSAPFAGQNSGAIAFGPHDGFLYVGLRDGGSTGDPGNRAQDGGSLLGKLLRLDVGVPPAPGSIANGAYAIPADNPFVGDPGVRDEIWALGLRNPYRFSFDRDLSDLWLADEGQDAREEVNFESMADAGGNNYGWDVMEGATCNADDPAPAPACGDISLVPPLHEYPHANGDCAITGGYVYRGGAPEMLGEYFFGDFCSGSVWSLDAQTGEGTDWTLALGEAAGKPFQLISFGEGGDGSLYAVHLNGDIYRIGVGACDQGIDSDCDGVPDDGAPGDVPCATGQLGGCDDNCPFASNPGQEDTAGLGAASPPDGIGDACQCGDVNGDGAVSSEDGVIILGSLLVPPATMMSRPDLCDVGGSVGCMGADSVIIQRALKTLPTATVQQVCEPANPLAVDGLAYWAFDDADPTRVSDSGPNGLHGALVNGADYGPGKFGLALVLDGVDDYVAVPDDALLRDLETFTYSAWVYATADGDREILSKATSNRELRLMNQGGALTLRGCVVASVEAACSNASDGSIALNRWHHVAMAYDDNADRMVRLFIDGQEVSYAVQSVAAGQLASDAPSELNLGRRTDGARPFGGRLDDVRIFARRLSLAEIAKLLD